MIPPADHSTRMESAMLALLLDPGTWAALFSVTLVQIALGADNLIIITHPRRQAAAERRQKAAIRWGLILAMVFRLILLGLVSSLLRFAGEPFHHFDLHPSRAPPRGRAERQGPDAGRRRSVPDLVRRQGAAPQDQGRRAPGPGGGRLPPGPGDDRRPQPAVLGRLDPDRRRDDRHLPRDGGLGGDLGGPDAGLRLADRRLHARQPRLRDPGPVRAAADRLRAVPRGRPRRPHAGQRQRRAPTSRSGSRSSS